MKKISIIIPIYNGADFLEKTVKTILKSSYVNLEVLLINDGSTDNTAEICECLVRDDDRIFYYLKENEGVVSARNFGVSKATGEYICFCDQDDFVEPEMYERLASAIEKNNSQMGMCSSGRDIDGKRSDFEVQEDSCYKESEIRQQLLFPLIFNSYRLPLDYPEYYRYPHIWNCMFRRDFWMENQLKFRAYINFEDDLLLKVEALSLANSVSTISYRGYYWRVNLRSETYAHRFVTDMGFKQQLALEDMERSLAHCINNAEIMVLFRNVMRCKQYIDAIHNLNSKSAPKDYAFRKKYFDEAIYNRDYKESLKMRKYLKKGTIKPHIILPLLNMKMSLLSLWAENMLDWILLLTLHSQILTKFERWLKK